jgi:hypothetical protein
LVSILNECVMQNNVINEGKISKSSIRLMSIASTFLLTVSRPIPPVMLPARFAKLPKPKDISS